MSVRRGITLHPQCRKEKTTQMIYPENFEAKVGFDEVRTMLKGRCLSALGIECVDKVGFLTESSEIRERLRQVSEMRTIINEEYDFPDENFIDVRQSLMRIRFEGTFLEELEMFDLKRSLATIGGIVTFFRRHRDSEETTTYPALSRLAEDVAIFPKIVERIDKILNKYGKIKDDASEELHKIRRDVESTTRGISHSLRTIIQNAQREGYIDKDVSPTLRDGRLVIPVAPALKRKIRGIIHDESASGRTVFIEPAEVVESNNRIRELRSAEQREMTRILKEFTDELRPHIENIIPSYHFLGEVDFIRAKSLVAETINAIEPQITDKPVIDWVQAEHPLLAASLKSHGRKIVPLDIELTPNGRILIISGPNAGGKSVCLKTVGLLQYMVQCGMSIPVRENSKVGVFKGLFIDIGDEQSIENELSTYSSHLLNMKIMMKNAGPETLLLIDELGSGTEPLIGGALAEAMMKRFIDSGTYGVITTHYQNLKHFADEHTGIVNGAMLYDRSQMQALFQLQIGQPGSSFAVEIARKIGIPEDVIADASRIAGSEYIQSDKYLQDIVRDKRYWEQKRMKVHQREKQLEQIIERYENEMTLLQSRRKEVMEKAKEDAQQLLEASNAKIENTIRSIREMQAEREKTREVRRQLEEFRNEVVEADTAETEDAIQRKIEQIRRRKQRREERRQRITKPAAVQKPETISKKETDKPVIGGFVRIKGQTSVGKLKEISHGKAIVVYGTMQVEVKAERLAPAQAPEQKTLQSAVYMSRSTRNAVEERKTSFKPDIDLRGMRGEEALRAVTSFIDDAQLLGIPRVRILHGTGTGALRELIRKYVATLPGIAGYRDEHVQFGGAGITVVDIRN